MKKFMQVVLAGMIVMSLLAGCGGGSDPKSLAKQAYDLQQKSMDAILKGDPSAAEKIAKDVAAIQKKIEALSDADKKIFADEYAKLIGNTDADDDEDEDDDEK